MEASRYWGLITDIYTRGTGGSRVTAGYDLAQRMPMHVRSLDLAYYV